MSNRMQRPKTESLKPGFIGVNDPEWLGRYTPAPETPFKPPLKAVHSACSGPGDSPFFGLYRTWTGFREKLGVVKFAKL